MNTLTKLQSKPSPLPAANTEALPTSPVLQSSALLGGNNAVEIEHKGQRYRLQATRAGRLILTK